MFYEFFRGRHGKRKRRKVILIDKFNYHQIILGIDMGKQIKVVELSGME